MKATVAFVMAVTAVASAGCGSAGPPAGAAQGSASAANDAPFRYTRCIRSHGVPNFPDPQVSTSANGTSVRQMVPASVASSPRFKAADKACQRILPQPGSIADHHGPPATVLLAFARCLRSHGESDFPDPNPQGQITRQMLSDAGVELRTPVFLSAARACIGVTHGAITPADVRAAVSGPH